MGLFKSIRKGVKRLRKNLHLPALTLGNAVKAAGAIAVPGGALGAVAGSVLRSKLKSAGVAGGKQILRTKAAKALVSRVARLAPPTSAASSAVTMPGGAPLSGAAQGRSRKTRRATHPRAKAYRRDSDTGRAVSRAESNKRLRAAGLPQFQDKGRKRTRGKRQNASGRKRRAPTGGLDLKALSVSWKAAGKPGRWIDWVKGHR